MAPPKVSWQISIGNIIQMAVFLVTLAVGWATLSAQVGANTDAIRESVAVRAAFEVRVRTIETSYARADERMTSICALLSRIDARLERIEQGQ